jgi:anti-anti-sigma factor
MPLYAIPVVVPYRLDNDPDGATYTVAVEAIATQASAAQAVAQVLVRAMAQFKHRRQTAHVVTDRVQVGAPGPQIDGPYAYVFTSGNRIGHLAFPQRIDGERGHEVNQMLEGLDQTVLGVLVDGIHLTYINSLGLAAFAHHASRLNLRMFRVSDPIAKVIEVTGLTRLIPLYPDLASALGELVRKAKQENQA